MTEKTNDVPVMLTKGTILKASDLKRELVEVPEWDGSVYVGTMTASARDEFDLAGLIKDTEGNLTEKQDTSNFRARLCAVTMQDEKGNLLFGMEDVAELSKKSAAAMQRVFSVAQNLNGMGAEEAEKIAKN